MRILLLCTSFFLFATALEAQQFPEHFKVKSIFFGGGSYYVDDEQKQELLDWIDEEPNLQEYDIIIHSHTDNIGSVQYNQWLSRNRSESVFQILLNHEIPPDWMYIKDFGEINPDFDNNYLDGRLKNRRVDVILVPPSS